MRLKLVIPYMYSSIMEGSVESEGNGVDHFYVDRKEVSLGSIPN